MLMTVLRGDLAIKQSRDLVRTFKKMKDYILGNQNLIGQREVMQLSIQTMENTTEISNIAHKEQEPIFITKNGYSDLVVMSSELYDKFARMNRIDQAIFESEQEIANGAEAVDAEIVFAELEKKHFG